MATMIPERRPEWLRVRPPKGENYENLRQLMSSKELHTVCEEARCPNIGEFWRYKTAKLMILGRVCTSRRYFFATMSGPPIRMDRVERHRPLHTVKSVALWPPVLTSCEQ